MNMKKVLAMMLAVLLIVTATVAGTVAWLYDITSTVTNTFTQGNIDINLDEADVDEDGNFLNGGKVVGTLAEADRVIENQYQAIPGKTYSKDPTLTVTKGNEKCYLFVKFVETGDPAVYYDYDFTLDNTDSGWTKLEEGVWYIIVDETAADAASDTVFYLLADNKIQVKGTVTKDNMAAAADAKLEWTAYAVQYMNDDVEFTPEQAWDIAQDGTLT